jgi:hypothetical protein
LICRLGYNRIVNDVARIGKEGDDKMSVDGNVQNQSRAVQRRILSLLEDMPVESLVTVEQFARFLHEQAQPRTVPTSTTPYQPPGEPLTRPYPVHHRPRPSTTASPFLLTMRAVSGNGAASA